MQINKNAQYRYQVLDRCFSDDKHMYGISELLEAVNDQLYDFRGDKSQIKERQLRDDINAIRNMLPPEVSLEAIPYDGKKCYYRYSDTDYSIYKNELSADELQQLRSVIDMLGRYRGIPSNAWLEEVITHLELKFGVKTDSEELISFGQNDQLSGLENLSLLIDATTNHTPLVISYCPFFGEDKSMTVHPYYMKQYNNRWFVFGLIDGTDMVANLALDRILEVDEAFVDFVPNKKIDFRSYFNDVVGVSVPNVNSGVKKEKVVLRFTPQRLPYVISKPIHWSQEQLNETDININVIPTRELTQQILSFGSDIQVLEPQWYSDKIGEIVKIMHNNYLSMQNECTGDV